MFRTVVGTIPEYRRYASLDTTYGRRSISRWSYPRLDSTGQVRTSLLRLNTRVVAKRRFNVARALPLGEHLDRQALKLGRAPRQARADARDERLGAIGDLRDAVLDGAFGQAQPAARITIAAPGPGHGVVLIVLARRGPPTSASNASSTILRTV